jgi:hypothetical protein
VRNTTASEVSTATIFSFLQSGIRPRTQRGCPIQATVFVAWVGYEKARSTAAS